ncbi:hypothetical protein CN094_26850 [Sinorhizobium meliloti]|nr:hypothetical protein CN101_23505 [Sinorhizobium meliloti]RVO54363.1 hypothetical protein CN094_26850 [Sinorhizobium meliloti]
MGIDQIGFVRVPGVNFTIFHWQASSAAAQCRAIKLICLYHKQPGDDYGSGNTSRRPRNSR